MKKSIIIGIFLILVAAVLLFIFKDKIFQTQPSRVYQVGILARGSFYEPAVNGFREKMAELGHIEGKNIIYDIRFVSAREDLPKVAKEFIDKRYDLIHTYSTPATQEAYKLTRDLPKPIPIVFGSMGDPLASGVIKDIQNPGTNVTGVASLSTELTAKRLELLKEINPQITRVAMPHTAREAGDVAANKSVDVALSSAKNLGIEILLFPVKNSADNQAVAKSITKDKVQGMILGGDSLILGAVDMYAKQATEQKIPFAAFDVSNVEKGALVGFGPDYFVSGQQSAVIINQILRGRNPGEIAVEVPQKLLLILNLKTAQSIGINLSEEFLKRVDITFGRE